MSEFKFNQDFYDSLSEEQKKQANDSLKQWEEKQKKELDNKIKLSKLDWEKEQEKNLSEKEKKDNLITSIKNEKNKKIAQEFIELGKTPEEIKEKYPEFFEEIKENEIPKPFIDLEELANLTHKNSTSDNKLESDAEFIKRVKKEGLGIEDSEEEWNRYDRLQKEGKF